LAEAGVEPGPFNVAGLARRFHVSRPHIDRLLKLACERELAVRTADGVRPGPALRDAVDRLLSTMMVFEIAFATSARPARDGLRMSSPGAQPRTCDLIATVIASG